MKVGEERRHKKAAKVDGSERKGWFDAIATPFVPQPVPHRNPLVRPPKRKVSIPPMPILPFGEPIAELR
jgi:hypothetical protein